MCKAAYKRKHFKLEVVEQILGRIEEGSTTVRVTDKILKGSNGKFAIQEQILPWNFLTVNLFEKILFCQQETY